MKASLMLNLPCNGPMATKADGSPDVASMLAKARMKGAHDQLEAELAAEAAAEIETVKKRLDRAIKKARRHR